MKRIFYSIVFCYPLLVNPTLVHSADTKHRVDIIGPTEEYIQSLDLYGPIAVSETLWSISSKVRPNNSVSVHQTVLAIYKLNHHAFYKGDIDNLLPQSVLRIPTLDYIAQQTDADAYQLLKKSEKPKAKKKVIAPTKPTEEVEQKVDVEPEIVAVLKNKLNDKEVTLATAEQLMAEQEKEYLIINEQLLEATEINQSLQLKVQGLTDQVNNLSADIEEEINLQNELQDIIEQYKIQIENYVEPPFSGDGLLNKLLSMIASSVASILFALFFPLLLLSLLFIFFLRQKGKRDIALEEKELSESTASLMEDSGKFDNLLDDNIDFEIAADVVDEIDTEDELEVDKESTSSLSPEIEEEKVSDEIYALDDELLIEEAETENIVDELISEETLSEEQVNTDTDVDLDRDVDLDSGTAVDDVTSLDNDDLSISDDSISNDDLLNETEQLDQEKKNSPEIADELLETDLSASEDLFVDETSPEPDAVEEDDKNDTAPLQDDILTQELSDVAFNEDVALPSADAVDQDGYINIDTLLEDTPDEAFSEDEFNLDFGLGEFPDVVNSTAEYDSDENGIAAQLDLARAYLEINDNNGAKEMLVSLLDTADDEQLIEVKKLIARIQ